MRSRTANRSGIVLRRIVTPAGDIIVTLLTPQGKLKAIARGGVRGPLSSILNLFHHVQVQVYQTPGNDLVTAKQAALEGALPTLAQPERYPYAHLLTELADTLFQEGELSETAFELYAASLRGISRHPDPEWVSLVMSYKLLALAGFIPQTAYCSLCGSVDPEHPDPLGGQLLCRSCASQAAYLPDVLDFLRMVPKVSVRLWMENPLEARERTQLWQALERFVAVQVGRVQSWRVNLPELAGA
ncbi:DNA repair protein RecO [Deinococcus ruber]|uniref:DNA repair protein RecO n=1 Tax=Deinococcus ruber TaxID=1848197 RepID=A0A918F231_9DEIO|nr:DNA repair protein RecO [Deinococcus ruber]GGQ93851.1 DNA repair protein RecO [Deinococcus ruber]